MRAPGGSGRPSDVRDIGRPARRPKPTERGDSEMALNADAHRLPASMAPPADGHGQENGLLLRPSSRERHQRLVFELGRSPLLAGLEPRERDAAAVLLLSGPLCRWPAGRR